MNGSDGVQNLDVSDNQISNWATETDAVSYPDVVDPYYGIFVHINQSQGIKIEGNQLTQHGAEVATMTDTQAYHCCGIAYINWNSAGIWTRQLSMSDNSVIMTDNAPGFCLFLDPGSNLADPAAVNPGLGPQMVSIERNKCRGHDSTKSSVMGIGIGNIFYNQISTNSGIDQLIVNNNIIYIGTTVAVVTNPFTSALGLNVGTGCVYEYDRAILMGNNVTHLLNLRAITANFPVSSTAIGNMVLGNLARATAAVSFSYRYSKH